MLGRRGVARRGPGILGTMARTAVVSGTATAVSRRVDARMERRAAAKEAEGAAAQGAPEAPDTSAKLAQLKELGDLKAQGILTDAEFELEKAKILG